MVHIHELDIPTSDPNEAGKYVTIFHTEWKEDVGSGRLGTNQGTGIPRVVDDSKHLGNADSR